MCFLLVLIEHVLDTEWNEIKLSLYFREVYSIFPVCSFPMCKENLSKKWVKTVKFSVKNIFNEINF